MGDEEEKHTTQTQEKRKSVSHMEVSASTQRRKSNLSSVDARATSRMQMRRPSYGFGGVPGVRPIERTSQMGFEFKRPILVYLPTYQLEPTKKFHLANVLKVIDQCLDEFWDGHKYNATESPALAVKLAGEVMRKVKDLDFNRYRIISVVTIAQRRKQSYNNTISFIWDSERDGYVDTHREEFSAFIQVTVFGIYFD